MHRTFHVLVLSGLIAGLVALAGPSAAANARVDILDFEFRPAETTVRVGDTVTWVWVGQSPHSVTMPGQFRSHPNCPPQVVPEEWVCGLQGHRYQWTPAEPGTYPYRCDVHPQLMTGTVVVLAAQPSPPPPPPPPPPSPPPPPPAPTPSPTASDPPPTVIGPPPPRPTEPLPTILPTDGGDSTPEIAPIPAATDLDLEAFPSPPPLPSTDPSDQVEVAIPGSSGPLARALPTTMALVGLVGYVTAFGRFVLFGDPW